MRPSGDLPGGGRKGRGQSQPPMSAAEWRGRGLRLSPAAGQKEPSGVAGKGPGQWLACTAGRRGPRVSLSCRYRSVGTELLQKEPAAGKIKVRRQEGPLRPLSCSGAGRGDGGRRGLGPPSPLLSLPIRGPGSWAAPVPSLISVLEKIKIYNPLPHRTSLQGAGCIRRRNGN